MIGFLSDFYIAVVLIFKLSSKALAPIHCKPTVKFSNFSHRDDFKMHQ